MKHLIQALGALLAVFLLALGCFFGWARYRQYQRTRGLRQARMALLAGDPVKASVGARRVLQINPKCAEACRIMAELAERSRSPAAVDWRQRVVELEPNISNRFQLAATALRLQHPPYALAAQTLHDLQPTANDLPVFQVLSAELALKLNRIAEAIDHFEAASRLEPENALHLLNLAALRLQSTNQETVITARLALERLSTNAWLAPLALRWRVAESLQREDVSAAEALSRCLLADPRAVFDDRLQHLSILQRARCPEFTGFLQSLQTMAVTNAIALYSLADWMGNHGLAIEALAWLNSFDSRLRETQPVPLAMANLYLITTNWTELEALLNPQQWPDLEFLRLAFLARAAWAERRDMAGDARWRLSLRAAGGRLGPLTLLLSLTDHWGRDNDDLLWQIAGGFPREQWALLELEKRYYTCGNTRGLNRVYATKLESRFYQTDSTNQNNFASSSMLLNVNLTKAYGIARELYQNHPDDAVIASTYAYSLHQQDRSEEGLRILGRLRPEQLENPSVSLYYGVLLAAAGEPQRAGPYLARASTILLLPEERELLRSAQPRGRSEPVH